MNETDQNNLKNQP